MPRPLLILALLLTAACSGVPTAPSELIALGNVRNTATAEAMKLNKQRSAKAHK